MKQSFFIHLTLWLYVSLSLSLPIQENTYLYRTGLYLAASASAEFFADIALAPMEAVKVRVQTQPGWANNLREGVPKLMKQEGFMGWVGRRPIKWFTFEGQHYVPSWLKW